MCVCVCLLLCSYLVGMYNLFHGQTECKLVQASFHIILSSTTTCIHSLYITTSIHWVTQSPGPPPLLFSLPFSLQLLPFLEYRVHCCLIHKLRLLGMNVVCGLRVKISLGETVVMAITVRGRERGQKGGVRG